MADRNALRREIGFVVMGFPRISETFISNEILQLESLGARLRVFAIKRGDEDRRHESVDRIRAPIEYLPRASSLSGTGAVKWLRDNLPRFRHAHGRVLRARPLAYLATLASALSCLFLLTLSRATLGGHSLLHLRTRPSLLTQLVRDEALWCLL